jgi:hypothetical protein
MPGDRIARVTTFLTAIGDATPTSAQQTLCWGITKRYTQHSDTWCCFTSFYFEPFASYLLTPWNTVLLEKLTGSQLVKKFPPFYGTWRFITASALHLSLSWASSIQSITPHLTSLRSILILSSHLRLGLPVVSFTQVSPPKPYTRLLPPPTALHAPPISFFSFWSPEQYWVRSTEY